MKNIYTGICILLIIPLCSYAQKEVSTASLLKEMINVERVTKWPDPFYQTYQASSYDRHSVAANKPGWFANADATQYLRTEQVNGRHEHVMMDADGPGTIVRFWLTTFKRQGTLRIYFDNDTVPEIVIPAYDLMKSNLPLGRALLTPHSSYEPLEKGGSNLYLPLPFSKHCKVTWQEAEPEKQPRYYQINYRKYAPRTVVKTFRLKQLSQLTQLLEEVNTRLLNPFNNTTGQPSVINQNINSGSVATINLPKGSQAIRCLQIQIKPTDVQSYAQALRSTVLQIKFDNQQTVWCPVGDFSGSGVGGKFLQSWYRSVNPNGQIVSRWIMPYQHSAQISILNTGSQQVSVQLTAITSPYQWDALSMYFHAGWKAESNVAVRKSEADNPFDWNLNTIAGKGVFMGESLAVYNYMHAWYGEGDQKLWVDNAKFPAEFGTGTEDYYNTSWAPVVLYQTPFANAPRADNTDSFGHNTFTRTRILDAVPFKHSFRFDLEMLGWQNGKIDAATVTYWYAFKNTKSILAPALAEASRSLPQ